MRFAEIQSYVFDHRGKTYMIKVVQVSLKKFVATPYLDGKVASHIVYEVKVDSMADWKFLYGDKLPYARLIEMIELDIKEGFGLKK